jgi:hypothetical protein
MAKGDALLELEIGDGVVVDAATTRIAVRRADRDRKRQRGRQRARGRRNGTDIISTKKEEIMHVPAMARCRKPTQRHTTDAGRGWRNFVQPNSGESKAIARVTTPGAEA